MATVSSMVIAQLEVATPPGFRLETLLLLSGIGNLLAGRMDSFLYILDDIHRGGVNLLGLTLDLMAHIAGEFPISRFKLASASLAVASLLFDMILGGWGGRLNQWRERLLPSHRLIYP